MYNPATSQFLGTTKYKRLALGAGGFSFRPKVANDGTLVISTDTSTGFYRKLTDSEWTPMIVIGKSIAEGDFPNDYAHGGTYDAAICASNSQHMLIYYLGYLWKTTNGGASFAIVAGQPRSQNIEGNGPFRTIGGSHLEYNPADNTGASFCFGDPELGFRYTTNGGTSFTTHAGIPAPTNVSNAGVAGLRQGFIITRDPSNSNRWAVFSQGRGVYMLEAGWSGSATLMTGSPTDITDLKFNADGTKLYAAGKGTHPTDNPTDRGGGTDGPCYRWSSANGWQTLTAITDRVTVCPHSTDPNKIYIMNGGGSIEAISDGGLASDRFDSGISKRVSDKLKWVTVTHEDYMSQGGAVHMPTSNTLVIGQGLGCWKMDNPLPIAGSNGQVTWTEHMRGIEQMVTMGSVFAPNGRFHYYCQDRSHFRWKVSEMDSVYPSGHGPTHSVSLNHAGTTDYAPEDPSFVVHSGLSQAKIWYSESNGDPLTFVGAASYPAGVFGSGNVVVGSKDKWLWAPTNNFAPHYTLDRGATWTKVNLGGVDLTGMLWHGSYTMQRVHAAGEKGTAGRYYLYALGNPGFTGADAARHTAVLGLWKTDDYGVNWTRQKSGFITTYGQDYWNCKLRCVPSKAGHLFWTPGDESGSGQNSIAQNSARFSIDCGVTWNVVNGVNEFHDFGFGKPFPGKTYPTIYGHGWIGTVRGVYRCTDFNPSNGNGSWELISKFPLGMIDNGWTVSADMNTHTHFVGFGGSGGAVGRYVDERSAS